jgi:hypothetical protein
MAMVAADAVRKGTTTEPLKGYKIVARNLTSIKKTVYGKAVQYAVGQTTTLDSDPDDVRPCGRGLHFCPKALDCLIHYDLSDGNRLLHVSVPVGSVVATADGGIKYAASALTVVADVTADAASLLTGCVTWFDTAWYEAGRAHRDVNDEPARVRRSSSSAAKTWLRHGQPFKGCLGKYSYVGCDFGCVCVRTGDGPVVGVVDAVERAQLAAIVARKESFET